MVIIVITVMILVIILVVSKRIQDKDRTKDDDERSVNFRSSVQERQHKENSLIGIERETSVDFRTDLWAYRTLREFVSFADAVEILSAAGLNAEEVLDAENSYETLYLDDFEQIIESLRLRFSDIDILKATLLANFALYDDFCDIILAAVRAKISIDDIIKVAIEDKVNLDVLISNLDQLSTVYPYAHDILQALRSQDKIYTRSKDFVDRIY